MYRPALIAFALLGVSNLSLANGLALGPTKVEIAEDHSIHRVSVEARIPIQGPKDLPAQLAEQGALIDFDLLDGIFEGDQAPCWLVSLPPACFVNSKVEYPAACGAQIQVVDRANQVVLFDLTPGIESLEFKLSGKDGSYLVKLDTTFLDIREGDPQPCWLPVLSGSEALSLHIGGSSGSTVPVEAAGDYEPGIPNVIEPGQ